MDICDYPPVLIGIKTKLDNANWFPIRHADTPDQKRFLSPAGSHLAGFVLSAVGDGVTDARSLKILIPYLIRFPELFNRRRGEPTEAPRSRR
jgi:hypothetical protein